MSPQTLLPNKNFYFSSLDGKSNNKPNTLSQAASLHSAGVHVISVGVGDNLDMDELNEMASEPKTDNLLLVENYAALPDKVTHIMQQFNKVLCAGKYTLNKKSFNKWGYSFVTVLHSKVFVQWLNFHSWTMTLLAQWLNFHSLNKDLTLQHHGQEYSVSVQGVVTSGTHN